jgi:hypothetical protein
MQTRAFRVLAATITQSVTAASVAVALNYNNGTRAVRIVNSGTTPIAVQFGVSTATTTAVATTSTVMLGNTVEVFTIPPELQAVATIGVGGAAGTAYIQIGEGL